MKDHITVEGYDGAFA